MITFGHASLNLAESHNSVLNALNIRTNLPQCARSCR
jgi:hypothetical protein